MVRTAVCNNAPVMVGLVISHAPKAPVSILADGLVKISAILAVFLTVATPSMVGCVMVALIRPPVFANMMGFVRVASSTYLLLPTKLANVGGVIEGAIVIFD